MRGNQVKEGIIQGVSSNDRRAKCRTSNGDVMESELVRACATAFFVSLVSISRFATGTIISK